MCVGWQKEFTTERDIHSETYRDGDTAVSHDIRFGAFARTQAPFLHCFSISFCSGSLRTWPSISFFPPPCMGLIFLHSSMSLSPPVSGLARCLVHQPHHHMLHTDNTGRQCLPPIHSGCRPVIVTNHPPQRQFTPAPVDAPRCYGFAQLSAHGSTTKKNPKRTHVLLPRCRAQTSPRKVEDRKVKHGRTRHGEPAAPTSSIAFIATCIHAALTPPTHTRIP